MDFGDGSPEIISFNVPRRMITPWTRIIKRGERRCMPVKGRASRRVCIKIWHGEKVGLFGPFGGEDL
jgi:hypothetical protein